MQRAPESAGLHLWTALITAIALAFAGRPAAAANATWNGTADAQWSVAGNWSASPVPGAGNTATFNNAGNGNTNIDLGAGVTIGTVLFDTTNAAAYTIGSGGVGNQALAFNAGGVTVNATVTNSQLFDAALALGTADGNATFSLVNNSTNAGLTFAGSISTTNTGAKTVSVSGVGAVTISGAMTNGSGSLALLRTGNGVLTLSGANAYTGGTQVHYGSVIRNGASDVLPDASGLAVLGTIDLNGYDDTVASIYFGADGVFGRIRTVTTGAGTLTLSGNIGIDSDTRGTNVISGKLSLGAATRSINNASYGGPGSTAQMAPLYITADISGGPGAGITSANSGLAAALVLSGNNSYTGPTTLSGGYLRADHANALGSGGNITFTGNSTLQYTANSAGSDWSTRFKNSNQPIRLDTGGQTVTLAGVIDNSNSGGLAKLGAGTLILSGTNTYGGTTTVSAGTLRSGASDVLPNDVTVSGDAAGVTATLDLDGNSDTITFLRFGGATATSGSAVATGAGTLTLANNVEYNAGNDPLGGTLSGNLSLGGATRTFTVGNSTNAQYDLTVSAAVSGTVAGAGLTKAGAGFMVLSGTNTYTGPTTVGAGVLQFDSLASIAGTGRNITVNAGGAVAIGYVPAGSIQDDLLSRIVSTSAGAVALTFDTAENFDFSAAGNNFSALFLGAIGSVNYTGSITPHGTAYRLGGGGGTLTLANADAISGANALTVGGGVILAATNSLSGTTTINAGATLQLDTGVTGVQSLSIVDNGTLIVNNADAQSYAGVVSGSGSLVKNGAGTLTLSVPQTYTGQTTVNAGTLALAGGHHTLSVNRVLAVNGGTLDFGTNSQYVGQFSGAGGVVTGSGGRFTTQPTGAAAFAGSIQGSVSLAKVGSQTLTLTADSSTTGAVHLLGGGLTLRDNGMLSGATGITISGGTLTLDNTGTTNLSGRVHAAANISLNSGAITYNGANSTASAETLGDGAHAVALSTGAAGLTATPGSGTASAVLTLDGLQRAAGAAALLRGSNLGTSANPYGRILVTGGPVGNLAPVNGVVPGAFYMVNTDNYFMLGYSSERGFGPLGLAGYPTVTNNFSAAGATDNVSDPASAVVDAHKTINSFRQGNLTFPNGTDTGGPDLLTIASGMTLMSPNTWGTTTQRGRITSGMQELFIFKRDANVTPDPVVNSVLEDNGNPVSLVVVTTHADRGPYVILTAPNTYSGGTFVDSATGQGGIELNATTAGTVVIPAGGLTINNNSVVDMVSFAGQIHTDNVVTIHGGGMLRLMGTNTLAGIVFNSNGGTVVPTVIPYNSNTLGGGNNFASFGAKTGALVITGDIVSVPENPAVTPLIDSGFLDLNGTTAHDITVAALPEGNYPNGSAGLYGLNISSVIRNGGFTKKGAGILNLTGNNTYGGDTRIEAGVLRISNKYLANGADVYLAAGAQLDLSFSGTADDVRSLYFDGAQQAAGTWGATGSGADHINDTFFRGTGKLNVLEDTPVPPVALFSASPTNGTAPLTVTFTDASTGTIDSRQWAFGDGGTTNTTLTSVSHTYTAAGTYDVELIVTGAAGSSTNAKVGYIVVTSPLPPVPVLGGNAITTAEASLLLHFDTVAGFKYGIEYRDSLSEGLWLPVVSEPDYPAPDGWSSVSSGAPMTIVDTNAAGILQRYYRLRAANP